MQTLTQPCSCSFWLQLVDALSTEPLPVEVNTGASWPIRLTAGVDARTGKLVSVPAKKPVAAILIKSPDPRRPASRNSRTNLSPATFISPTASPGPEADVRPASAAELNEFEMVANLVHEAVSQFDDTDDAEQPGREPSPLTDQAPITASVVDARFDEVSQVTGGQLRHANSTRPRPAGRRKPSRTSITNLRTSPEATFDTPC